MFDAPRSVLVCLSAGDFQAQLYDHQRDEDPPATQDLGIVVVAKDPDDEVCHCGSSSTLNQLFFNTRKLSF